MYVFIKNGLTWYGRELVLPALVHSSLPEGPACNECIQRPADATQRCDDEARLKEEAHMRENLRR